MTQANPKPPIAPRQRLLTNRQAAAEIGVSEHTLNTWRCTRRVEIPYLKVGRSVRYTIEALEAFKARCVVGEVVDNA